MCNRLNDTYFGSGKALKKDIEKYGKENFIFTLEIDLKNKEEMNLLEEMVVNKDFLARPDVYNIAKGGVDGPCMYGNKNPFYGKTHSEEIRKQVSLRFKGKKLSESHRLHIKESINKLFNEHPEILGKFATRKGKRKCQNIKTGEIRFFKVNEIPEDFKIYEKPVKRMTDEQRKEFKRKCSEKSKNSKWFNNGVNEIFCPIKNKPDGYFPGRLPTTNVGRIFSEETKLKMRNKKIGKSSNTKGKIAITDGIKNRYISKDDPIPARWKRGFSRRREK